MPLVASSDCCCADSTGFLKFDDDCIPPECVEDGTLSEKDLPALLAMGLFTVTLLCVCVSFTLEQASLVEIISTLTISLALKCDYMR